MIELLFPNIEKGLAEALTIILDIFDMFLFVLLIIGEWHVFKKFKEKSWKALVPYYSQYIMYKHTWKKSAFWIYFICDIGFTLSFGISEVLVKIRPNDIWADILSVLALPFGVIMVIYIILSNFRIAEAFGKRTAFGIGLTFFYQIFILILGFGKSEYVAPTAYSKTESCPEGTECPPDMIS